MYTLILVDYNSIEKTVEYIDLCNHYLDRSDMPHVVIVDNSANDNALQVLHDVYGESKEVFCETVQRKLYCFKVNGQDIIYCKSGGNLGYAKGNNLGVEIADSIWNDPFYLISNNDLVFSNELDLSMVERLFWENPQIGVIGPKVITPQGEQQSPRKWQGAFHRLVVPYWVILLGNILGGEKRKQLWERYCNDTIQNMQSGFCDWVSGCFMFVRAEAFQRAGMFDENTFLYAEEMILSERLNRNGDKTYYCNELEVIHKHAQTIKKAISALNAAKIDFKSNYYLYKNYRNTPTALLWFAKVNFSVFCALFKLKIAIKDRRNM